MAKTCLACKDIINIKKDTPLDCTSCKNSYHIQCVGVPVEKNTKVLQSTWTCPSCAIKPPRGDNSNTPVQFPQSDKITLRSKLREARASASSANSPCNQCVTQDELISNIRNEIREAMRDDLTDIINTCLKGQLKQLREEINDVKDSISFTNAMFEEFKSDVISAKSTMHQVQKENEDLRATTSILLQRIHQLEQLSRISNLEIQCVPETKGENAVSYVTQLGHIIKCEIRETDISYCSRTAKANPQSTRPRSILVKFQSSRTRDSYLAAASKYNKENPNEKLNTALLGIALEKKSPVYVVEHLTPDTKSLHTAARQKAKELGWKYTWVKNGRVLMRKSDNSDYVLVRDIQMVNNLK